jgi:hemerythrin-like domain-containing protein
MSVPVTLSVIRDEHQALSALLQSLAMLVRQGPGDDAARFFDSVRAMLFYIDEFPERIHHPKESERLFPRLALRSPQTRPAIARLDQDHQRGEAAVRELQHLLLAWELLGEGRRAAFTQALTRYVGFYLEHMRIEEHEILPAAEATLSAQDWSELDQAFGANRDPLTGRHPPTVQYEKLFQRIAREAPAPIGLGD